MLPRWQKTSTLTYDALGRPITVKDTNDALVSKTTYTPAAAGPLTATAVENRKLHKSTTLVDFATGAPTKVTDPNGKITESEYDSLGRLTNVWLPNRSKALGKTPNHVYAYNVTSTDMSWVSTSTLKGDASGYNTSYTFYDSQLRPRQTQSPTPAGGRLTTVNLYDTRGMAVSQHNDIWDSTKLPSSTPATVSGGQAPIQTDTTYDGAGRVIKAETKIHGVTRWTTTTAYTGDTVTSTAPAGGQATAVVTNALGQTTERREYAGPQPTGTGYTSTRFTYHPAGQQATITGPDQTTWSYTYDLFGRQTATTDPDKGKTTTHYNALDQVESTTPNGDASKKLLYEYDVLGRKTGMWQKDQTDANKLAAWTFDTLDKGQQDTAVRYDGGATLSGKAYTQKVTAYDSLYNATSSELILPEGDAFKAELGTTQLKFTAAYRVDGTVAQTGSPAVGGLPSEIVSYTYNTTGQQLTARGTTGYLQGAAFSPQGDLRQLRLGKDGTAGKQTYITNTYENGTRRLTGIQVTDDVHSYPLQDLTFTQDDAGNVTSIFDTTTLGGTAKPDHQCFAYDGYSRMTEAWTPKTADCAATGRTTVNIDGQAPTGRHTPTTQQASAPLRHSTGQQVTQRRLTPTTTPRRTPSHTRWTRPPAPEPAATPTTAAETPRRGRPAIAERILLRGQQPRHQCRPNGHVRRS